MRVTLAVLLGALSLACSGTAPRTHTPPPPEPEPDAGPAPEPEAIETGPVVPEDAEAPTGGTSCVRTSECGSGLACRGAPGCISPWACGAARESCGPDTVSYCDCDGFTFHAQAGCPNRTYAHVGPCEDPGIADASFGVPNGDEPIVQRDRTCSTSSECRGGEICYGPPGCGMAWRCERARGCARRGRGTFCSCNGETFSAQRSCPGQPYSRAGACDEVVASAEPSTSTSTSASASTSTPTTTSPSTTTRPPTTTTRPTTTTPAAVSATPPRPPRPPLGPGECRTNRDCGRGEVCAGPAGCGDAWTCIRRTDRCNPDTQYFCDCEGHSFTASMTCPTRPYVHRGSCDIDHVIDLAGAALR